VKSAEEWAENAPKIAFAKKIDGRSHMLKQATWNSVSQSAEEQLTYPNLRLATRKHAIYHPGHATTREISMAPTLPYDQPGPKLMKIAVKCTVQNRSQNGPKIHSRRRKVQ
jgi:hypothetical protein